MHADLKISVPTWPGKWVVGMEEYAPGVVGAKSRNIANLRGKLPESVSLPASVTLPFGCFEQVRSHGGRAATYRWHADTWCAQAGGAHVGVLWAGEVMQRAGGLVCGQARCASMGRRWRPACPRDDHGA